MRKIVATIAAVAGCLLAATAQAGNVQWSIGINLPPVATVVSGGPVYAQPVGVPVYVEPAPVYVAPPPVYVQPPPVYVPPPPVYLPPPAVYVPSRVVVPAPVVVPQPVYVRAPRTVYRPAPPHGFQPGGIVRAVEWQQGGRGRGHRDEYGTVMRGGHWNDARRQHHDR